MARTGLRRSLREWCDPALHGSLTGKLTVSERDKQDGRALYGGNLRWADHNLGLLRAQLEAAGLWDEALVIVTSDHGEAFWQHGRWGHSDHLIDEQLRVPLVVKLPAGRGLRGVVRDDLVSLLDVTPSVCEWLDVAPGMLPLDGFSLAERGDKPWGHVARTQHFDLALDGGELHDLYAKRQAPADADAARLIEWGQEALLDRNEPGTGLSRGEVELLRGLGYVDVPPANEAQANDEH